ncbi:hypothetical protein AALP_AAs44880U000300, partial [Arabis alpina]
RKDDVNHPRPIRLFWWNHHQSPFDSAPLVSPTSTRSSSSEAMSPPRLAASYRFWYAITR